MNSQTIKSVVFDQSISEPVELTRLIDSIIANPISVRRLFRDKRPLLRLFALVQIANEISAGAETSYGVEFGLRMLDFIVANHDQLVDDQTMLSEVTGALVSSTSYALFQEGRFSECEDFPRSIAEQYPYIISTDGYWSATAVGSRSFSRRFRLDDATHLLATIPDEHRSTPHYIEAESAISRMISRRFEVEPVHSLRDKHASIWTEQVDQQLTYLTAVLHDMERSPPEAKHLRLVGDDIRLAIDEMHRFSAELDSLNDTEKLRQEIIQSIGHVKRLTLRTQNVQEMQVHSFNLLRVNDVLEQANLYLTFDSLPPESIFGDIDESLRWSSKKEDVHGVLMLSWSAHLLSSTHGVNQRSQYHLGALIHVLESAMNNCAGEDERSRLANFFVNLPEKAFDQFAATDSALIFRACELRKDRVLISQRSLCSLPETLVTPNLLGSSVHYLSLSVLEYNGRILASLYCANGTVTNAEVSTGVSEIRAIAGLLDPATWSSLSLFSPPVHLMAKTLEPVLHIVAEALNRGNIARDEHLCIAADDPLSLIPLQSIKVLDKLCIDWVSISRVVSFRDAISIVAKPICRTTQAIRVWAPVAERQEMEKSEVAERVHRLLQEHYTDIKTIVAPIAKSRLFESFKNEALIHIDAHGSFPSGRASDAFNKAGLLIPTIAEHDQRVASENTIVSARDILSADVELEGAHLSLNACVSGVALPGYAGDSLGLELVFRLKGASSVMATHWEVNWKHSGVFYEYFYDYWLNENQSRASAWRQAILALQRSSSYPNTRDESWGFVSIYGDWR